MYNIVELATRLNRAYNLNHPQAGDIASLLYNEVGPRRQGGRALLTLSDDQCQCVGLAFTHVALDFDFGDQDINSVACENAFYCLCRNLIKTGNSFVAPAIFTILTKSPTLLKDQLISSWCDIAQKQVGMPIGMMLGGNPFRDPRLENFRQQAMGFKEHIRYYVLEKFYDIESHQYTISIDRSYFMPSEDEIIRFLSYVKANVNSTDIAVQGERHMLSVYRQCEETLSRY